MLFPALPLPYAVPLGGYLRARIVLDAVAHILFVRGVVPAPLAALTTWRSARVADEAAWCAATARPFPRSLTRTRAMAGAAAWADTCAIVERVAACRPLAAALLLVGASPRRPKYAAVIDFTGGGATACAVCGTGTGTATGDVRLPLPRATDATYAAPPGEGIAGAVARKAARALITEGDRLGLHGGLLGSRPVTLLLLLPPSDDAAVATVGLRAMPGFALPRDVRAAWTHLAGARDDPPADATTDGSGSATASEADGVPPRHGHHHDGASAPLLLRRGTPSRAAVVTLDVVGSEVGGAAAELTPVQWYAVVSTPALKGFGHMPPPLPPPPQPPVAPSAL